MIAARNRFVSFRDDMKPADWEAVYGESVRIMNEDIISAFRPDQIEAATSRRIPFIEVHPAPLPVTNTW